MPMEATTADPVTTAKVQFPTTPRLCPATSLVESKTRRHCQNIIYFIRLCFYKNVNVNKQNTYFSSSNKHFDVVV